MKWKIKDELLIDGKPCEALAVVTHAQRFYEKARETIKLPNKPLLALQELDQMLVLALNEKQEGITRGDILKYAYRVRPPQTLEESKILWKVKDAVNNKETYTFENEQCATVIMNRIQALQGVPVDVQLDLIHECEEFIENGKKTKKK